MANCNISIFGPSQHLEADAFYNEAKSKPTKRGASISGPVSGVKIKRPDTSGADLKIGEVASGSYVVTVWDK